MLPRVQYQNTQNSKFGFLNCVRIPTSDRLLGINSIPSSRPPSFCQRNWVWGKSQSSARSKVAVMAGIGNALISVSDKSGIVELAQGLVSLGYDIISTGGSAKALQDADVPVRSVEEVTGQQEMLDGRVKTLQPAIHAGILAKSSDERHMFQLIENNIEPIDVVVVNLYPFRSTVLNSSSASSADIIENIDIGGVALIRGAAKNHERVYVVVDPTDYDGVLKAIKTNTDTEALRLRLAWKGFQHCATYDSWVSEWMWSQVNPENSVPAPALTLPLTLSGTLRYGENPHQPAAVYGDDSLCEHGLGGVQSATQHHGKEMSYNNYLDADAAYGAVCDLAQPACVIVKHTNPCGLAINNDLLQAYRDAVLGDPISAFGGIVAFNRPVDADLARELREFRSPTDNETRMFYEIVIAPEYTKDGLEVLQGKSKALRILEAKPRPPCGRGIRQIGAGWLLQSQDCLTPATMEWTVLSKAQPSEKVLEDLRVGWVAVKHVKSNAITVVKGGKMLGMGSGQPNRVQSVELALEKAGSDVKGAVLASDAFFPFAWNDAVEKACQAGIVAIAHPGGSRADEDTVACCDKYGVVLVQTGVRHFKH